MSRYKRAAAFTYYLALRVIALFVACMLFRFFTGWIQSTGFFGDTPYQYAHDEVDPNWHWGAGHYFYFWMCIILFAISILRIFIWICYYLEKYELLD